MTPADRPPPGETTNWLPTAPTQQHGTRDLIDTELIEVWDHARDAAAHVTDPSRHVRNSVQADIYQRADAEIERIHTSIDHGPARFAAAPADVFGLTVADVELLTHTGRIRPETSAAALTNDYTSVGGLTGGLILGIGIVVSLNLADGAGVALAVFSLVALMTALPMILMKKEKLRKINETGPAIELHDGSTAETVTIGRNPALATLMADVAEVATSWDDPIWGFYTEITALADEAGRSLYDRGLDDDKAGVYNASIATLAANLRDMIDHRNAKADARRLSEREASHHELIEHPDNGEDAELLAARLRERITAAEQARRDLAD